LLTIDVFQSVSPVSWNTPGTILVKKSINFKQHLYGQHKSVLSLNIICIAFNLSRRLNDAFITFAVWKPLPGTILKK
jgi:queuine/archaeosine tRNA-ribosyltransferase